MTEMMNHVVASLLAFAMSCAPVHAMSKQSSSARVISTSCTGTKFADAAQMPRICTVFRDTLARQYPGYRFEETTGSGGSVSLHVLRLGDTGMDLKLAHDIPPNAPYTGPRRGFSISDKAASRKQIDIFLEQALAQEPLPLK